MNNNDILRNLRYAFDLNDDSMIGLFAEGGTEASRAEISSWMKREDDADFKSLTDLNLAVFLNGFIILKRGRKEGPAMEPEKRLNNNIVLRKLKIALNLNDEDLIEIFALKKVRISKHELSAFFRKPNQEQFRHCNDQYLRNFLYGLQIKYRGESEVREQ